jgi:hypothetical protein
MYEYTTNKGFEARLPNKQEIEIAQKHFKSIIRHWRTAKIKTVYAYVNALVYRVCRNSGVLQQARKAQGSRKGFHRIVGDIKALALKGCQKFNITIEGIVDQLSNFWGISISEASLRKYRYELRDVFGLFWFESNSFPKGQKGNRNNRRPPALEDFDLPLSCILLEALEDVLMGDRDCRIEEFPGFGAMSRFIYDALFRGISSYRRKAVLEDASVIYQGGVLIKASEIDWNDNALTYRGLVDWLGVAASCVSGTTILTRSDE